MPISKRSRDYLHGYHVGYGRGRSRGRRDVEESQCASERGRALHHQIADLMLEPDCPIEDAAVVIRHLGQRLLTSPASPEEAVAP